MWSEAEVERGCVVALVDHDDDGMVAKRSSRLGLDLGGGWEDTGACVLGSLVCCCCCCCCCCSLFLRIVPSRG